MVYLQVKRFLCLLYQKDGLSAIFFALYKRSSLLAVEMLSFVLQYLNVIINQSSD